MEKGENFVASENIMYSFISGFAHNRRDGTAKLIKTEITMDYEKK